jgi:hypothetical protein
VSERKAQWQIEIFADEKAVSLVPASSAHVRGQTPRQRPQKIRDKEF